MMLLDILLKYLVDSFKDQFAAVYVLNLYLKTTYNILEILYPNNKSHQKELIIVGCFNIGPVVYIQCC